MGSLAFTDAFPDGLAVAGTPNGSTTCGGTFAPAASATSLAFTGGRVAAGQTCTLAVDVRALVAAGALTGTSGDLTSDLPVATPGVAATLTVNEVPLSVSIAFEPPAIRAGSVSRLTYELGNDTALAAMSVALSDTLPADVVLAPDPNVDNNCGGTLTAAGGDGDISYSGGSLGAGAACTIAVDVTSVAVGIHPNGTESVTSSLGTSTAASATLTVDAADAPGFARVFSPDTIPQGGETQIVFTVDNTANLIDLGELAFTDAFPDGLVVAGTPNASTTCGGTFSPVAGATTLAFADGALAAGATCEIRVAVRAIGAGALTGPAVTLTSNVAPATAAEARLDVTPPEAPGFAKAFSAATVAPGGVSTLTFTIDNAANLIDVGGLAFTDAFPDGLAVADPPNGSTTCGGTFAPAASATSLAFTGGRVAAGQTCTISVDVLASRAGALTGMSGDLTSDLPVTTSGASATLTVNEEPLSVSMSFSPAVIGQGRVSRLTYDLNNGAAVAATSVDLSDSLPADVVVAAAPNAQTTCAGGTLTAAAGGSEVSYSGGTLGAGATCMIAVDVTSVAVGRHPNDMASATSSLGDSTPAEATLTIDPAAAPDFARVFSPDTIGQGGETQIVFTVDNTANAIAMTGMAFGTSLPSGVSVADTPGTGNSCGGTFNPVAGATTLSFADGVLAAGAMCEIRVTVRAIEAGTLTGPAVALMSSIATATAAEAMLTVGAATSPGFVKVFSPDTVDPGGVSTLTYTIDNAANLIDVGGLAFDDDFPDGLAVAGTPNGSTTCGGTFAPAASATSLAFTGGRVAAGQTCTISVDVLASRAGALTGTSSDLTSDLPVDAPGVPATLTVREAPLSVSMSFSPAAIGQGGVSRLTYGLDNGAAVAAASVSLSDSLPAGVVLADPPDAQTTCTGGTLTAAAGGSEVSYSGGTLGAGATCTIAVDVTSTAAGSHRNSTETVTSSLGASPPAEATLTVDAAAAPDFARVFSPDTIPQGGETQIVFTVDNTANAIAMTGMAFDDPLPSGVSVADTPGASNSCGGTFSPVAGATTLAFTGGVLAAGATCELRVTVRALEAGTLTGPAVALMSSIATATAAEAMLTVGAATSPGFSKAFSPDTVDPGGVSTLTYTIDNAANLIDVGGLAFDDDFPDGLAVAGTPNGSTTCGGTFAPAASATSLAFTGGRVAAGQTCTISVDVVASRAGALTGTSGDLTSDLPVNTSGAAATLTVNEAPLSVSMSFAPTAIGQGGVSRLTYMLENGAAVAAADVALSDSLPADVVLAPELNADNGCGGFLSATPGGGRVSYSGGSLAAGATCTIAVDVTSAVAERYPNDTERVTSSLGTSAAASATLTVTEAEPPLSVSMSFSPSTIDQGGVSRLTYRLDNGAAVAAADVALSDRLPADVVLAPELNADNGCGGFLSATPGGVRVSYSGGSLGASATCTIAVDVTSAAAGSYPNDTESATSSLGTSTAASATLTVDAPDELGFARAFSPATVDPGGISRLTYRIDNTANAFDVGSLAFTDDFPDGLAVAGTPNGSTTCGGTFAPAASATSLAFSGGRVGAGGTCTISVDVLASRAGALTSTSGDLTSDLPVNTSGAAATLTVNEAPLSVSMSFEPTAIGQGGVSRLTYRLDNGAAVAAADVALFDRLPADVVLAPELNADNGCGGFLSATPGGGRVSYSGGSLGAGAACTIAVDVTSAVAERYPNDTESATSSLGTSTAASATLTVDAPDALGFAKAFSPATVDPGGIARLTFTIDNTANAFEVGSLAFTDAFPDGLAVAGTPNASTTCGGTFAPAALATSLAFTGGRVGAGGTCAISVDVVASRAGALTGTSGDLTSDLPVATPGVAATPVEVNEAPLSVSMSFAPPAIRAGGVSRLTYMLDNGAAVAAADVALLDRLPADVVLAPELNADNGCGGFLSATPGGVRVSYSGGSLGAGATCTIAVDVTSAVAERYPNDTERATSSLGTSTAASATLTVDAPDALGFAKAFSPATVDPGGISRLTYRIDNTANAFDVGSLAFTDAFPDGLAVAGTPNGSTTCGGTFAPAASATSLASSGGRVGAGQSCAISVDVVASRAGALTGTSGDLTSDLPVATSGASATLTVNEAPLSVSMSFEPTAIGQGGVSRLTYMLDNGTSVAAADIALLDRLPADVVLAPDLNAENGCGGFLSATPGGVRVSYSGGSLAASATCTIAVDVTSAVAERYPNDTERVTSSLGTSAAASATLTVTEAEPPLSVSMSFSPSTIGQGGVSRLTYVLRNGAAVAAADVALLDRLPADVVLAPELNADNGCGGFLSATPGGVRVSYSGGSLVAGATCTIAVDVTSAAHGSYPNDTESAISSLGTSTVAEATLTVDPAAAPGFARVFLPDTIRQGGETEIVFTVDNGANAIAMTGMAFADSLPSGVSVADTPGTVNGCGGTFSPVAGATTLAFTGGVLAAGATCELRVTVRALEAGTLTDPAVDLTSNIATASAAEATLTVDAVDALGFAKAFSPATVDPGGVSRLTYRIDNGANVFDVGSLAFTDAFPDGLAVAGTPDASTTCGGTFAPAASATSLAFSGGRVGAGQSCAISVDVVASRAGTLTGTSGDLTSDLPVATSGASAALTVNEAPLSVSMSFAPSTIDQGGVSRLTYRLDNGAAVAAVDVALLDRLPADVVLAPELNADNGCGGVLSATPGGVRVSYSGGSLVAGATCTIAVDVTSAADGSHLNGTESATSSLGTSTVAEATLTVDPAAAPGFARVFEPDTIRPGGETEIVFTVDNGANAIAMTGMAFDASLPSGVSVADTPGAVNGCGGTFSPVAGATTLAFTGGALATGATCELRVTVRALEAGTLTGPAVDLTSNIATASAAEATLTVDAVDALGFAKAFSPATVDPGGVSRLTYRIDNGANAFDVGSLAFTDAFPDGLAVAGTPDASTTCGGTFAPAASATSLAFSGGRVAAGQSCTLAVDVVALRAGALTSTSSELTSDLPVATPGVAATPVVVNPAPLSVSMSFAPSTIDQGGVSRLTYVLRNGAAVAAADVALSDRLPADVVLAPELNADNGCGGFLSATPGGVRVSYSGGLLGAFATCTIAVDVTSAADGSHLNGTESATSSLGTSTVAEATLTVDPAAAPGFARVFEPDTIRQGGETEIVFTVDNGANAIAMTGMAFADSLPSGVSVADTPGTVNGCGGTFSPVAGATTLAFTGGALAAGATCELRVTVRALEAGTLTGPAVDLTSNIATASAAEATLTVDAVDALGFAKAFSPATVDPGGVSRLTYRIDNGANAFDVGSLAFTDAFPDGLAVAGTPDASTTCGGTFAPAALATSLAFTGGRVAAGGTCVISVDVQALAAGALTGTSGDLTSDLPVNMSGVSATLTVNEAPLSVSMSFAPPAIRAGGVSRLTYELRNGAAVAAADVALLDRLPADVVLAPELNADNGCDGVLSATPGGVRVSYSGGSLGASATCTIAVDVTSAVAERYPNDTERAISSLGTSTVAEATLTVDAVDALGFARAFSPATVDPGGISTLTYRIDNGVNAFEVGSLAFTDDFPDGLAVAGTPNGSTTCGGSFAPAASATSLAFSGGRVAAGGTCTISVDVVASRAGALTGTSGDLTSDLPVNTSGASATLTVNPALLSVSMSFSPLTIGQGGVSRLTYMLDNGASVAAADVALSDRLPADVVLAPELNAENGCGGFLSATPGGGRVSYSRGSLAAGATCTIAVGVTSAVAERYPNDTERVTSSLGTSAAASATLTVTEAEPPLSVSMSFSPSTIGHGGVSRLTYELRNGAAVTAADVALLDRLPADVVLAPELNADNGCGGFLSATPGGVRVSYSGGSLGVDAACTIAVDVTSAAVGRYPNETERVTSTHGDSTPASATLTVEPAAAPGFAKAFSPATVDLGGISRLTYTIDNSANLIDVGGLAFDDDFPDGLAVAGTPDAATTCGGTFAPAASATSLVFTGGAVAAGQSCELSVDVVASRAGALTGRSSDLTSDLPVDAPGVEATLTVNKVPLSVSMSFEPLTIGAGGVSRLTYVLRNGARVAATSVTLSDTLPTGVVVADPPDARTTCAGGTLTAAADGGDVSYSGGSLAVATACTIAVDVTSAAVGRYPNETERVTSTHGDSTPASATLTVNEPPLSVSMSFEPPTIGAGGVSRLTYVLRNGAAVGATSVTLFDRLPADVVLAPELNQNNGCGGFLSATPGGRRVSYSRGSLGLDAACTIAVDVTSAAVGRYPNETERVTSTHGDSTPASATLTVNEPPLSVLMSFSPSSIGQGGVSRLTYVLRNGARVAATSVTLSDTLPTGVLVADPPDARTTCAGGTLTAEADGGDVSYSGGSLAAATACTIAVDVTSAAVGRYPNETERVTSTHGDSTPASATLTVNEAPLSVSMSFEPLTIRAGGVSRLTYVLRNGARVAATSVTLSDTLPTGVLVADPPDARTTCAGGTLTAEADGGDVSYSGGSLAAATACTIAVDVTSAAVGRYPNETERVTSTHGDSTPASATLTVNEAPLSVSMSFEPLTIRAGGVSRLTYVLRNGAAVGATSVTLFDRLPADVVLAPELNQNNGCGGFLSATPGGGRVSYSRGSLGVDAACTIAVDVTSAAVGRYPNETERVTSTHGDSTPASATLTVNEAPLSVSMSFEPLRWHLRPRRVGDHRRPRRGRAKL